jgi:tRNA-Thr(GGU) m(6)t(6)A37 methyltransferase TsaA
MKMIISIKPIGIVHVNLNDDEVKAHWNEGIEGIIEIYEDYAEGLYGIEGFSHIILIAYLHKVTDDKRKVLKVKPRRLKMLGLNEEEIPEVGVFCTDSPHRPNPIAITIVELIERNDRFLKVKNLDLFDKTPILDIKPYTYSRIVQKIKIPEWYEKAIEKLKSKYPQAKDF